MRWMLTVAILGWGLPAWAQENEAEKLFRKAEQQIRSAKGLKVVFEVEGEVGSQKAKSMGYLLVAEGNKGRVEVKTFMGDKSSVGQMISDGKEFAEVEGGKVVGERRPVDPASTESALAISIRAGVLAVLQIPLDPKNKLDVDKALPASEFKLTGKEMVGTRQANVLTYKLAPPMGDPIQMTLWLDATTALPLKRSTLRTLKDIKISAVEVYTEIVLNPTIDAKIFELPK
jgi:outer membrane lipoprotein-sorting protein